MSSRGNEAAELLADIAAGDGASRLKQATAEPARTTIAYQRSAGPATGDLYRGAEPPRGAAVVVPGLTPHGKDDARLVAFARSLARGGFLVLVPDIPNTRALKVSAADNAYVVDAIGELAERATGGSERAVALVAISFAAGPALIAAGETEAGRRVKFAVVIGGYYDIAAAIGYATTGAYRMPDGSWHRGTSNDFGKYVFLRGNADRVANPADRARLTRIADRGLADPAASVDDLVAGLGPEGKAVHALIENRDPEQVSTLIARLPNAIRQELRRLDLKGRELPSLAGPVFLIHGEDDTVIPAGESARLAAALGGRAELYLVARFAHVDAAGARFADRIKLWNAAVRVLEERDRPDAQAR